MTRPYLITLAIILSAYFIFTSGIPFELAKVKDIARFETPYNVALSDSRVDLSGHYTQDDVAVRDWLYKSDLDSVYSDLYGVIFLQELMSYEKKVYFIPEDLEIPQGSYVFLRSWTNTKHELSFWTGAGTRKGVAFNGYEGEVVYQVGESKIVRVR